MSARIPAIVLGGTGYVAGELLRLHRRPPAVRARRGACRTASPGEPRRGGLPAPAPAPTRDARFSSQAEIAAAAVRSAAARRCSRPRRTACRRRSIDSLLQRRRSRPARSRASSTSRPTSATQRRGLRGGVQARARRAAAPARVHLRGARAPGAARHRRTSRTPAASPRAMLLASVPLLAAGLTSAAAVRQRRHRQHRLGPQAHRGHASPAAAQRPLHLQRARATATRRRSPPARVPPPASTPSFAFVPHSGPFARGIHVTVQAPLKRAARHARRCSAALRELLRAAAPFVRVSERGAARQGRRRQQLRTPVCRSATAARSRSCARSTTSTRAPPAAPCSG